MIHYRLRTLVLPLIAATTLFAVSCGGSGDGASDGTDAANEPAASDDDAAAEPAASDDDAAAEPADAGSVEAYCQMKAESNALFDEADPLDPESVEAAFRENVGIIDAALQIIPAEIEDDLRVVRQSMDDYIDVLAANDWNFFAASSAIDEIEDPELEAAEARLETWEGANCDFPDDGDDFEDALNEDPFSTPEAFEAMLETDAGRTMMIEGMTEDGELTAEQAECMLDNLDFELLSALTTGAELGPESLTSFFEMGTLCELDETYMFEDLGNVRDIDDSDFADPELLEAFLATETGRAMMIEGMTEGGELTAEQAECMLDNLDFVAIAALSNEGEPDPELFSALFQVAVTCDLGEEFLAD